MSKLYGKNGRLYLDPQEREIFFKTVEKSDELEEKCFCLVFIYTGCRMGEALDLRPENIETSKHVIDFGTLKQRSQNNRRAVNIPEYLTALLGELMATQNGGKLFPFSRWKGGRIIKKYMKSVGLDGYKASSRGLRRAYAISNSCENTPVATIKKWLGHKQLTSTNIYIEFDDPKEREMAKKAWPDSKNELPLSRETLSSIPMTETKFFSFEVDDIQSQINKMNTYIKNREAQGWSVTNMEHITQCKSGADQKPPHSKGILVIFVITGEATQ